MMYRVCFARFKMENTMADWITLQDAAEIIGVRKGTLCMWRLRNKFPFKSKGKGRGLMINKGSVKKWVAEGGRAGIKPGRPPKTTTPKTPRKVGRPAGIKTARKASPGRPPKALKATTPGTLSFRTEANLIQIQDFVAAVKGGQTVQVLPDKSGYILTLNK